MVHIEDENKNQQKLEYRIGILLLALDLLGHGDISF